jgi:hypothetical protein
MAVIKMLYKPFEVLFVIVHCHSFVKRPLAGLFIVFHPKTPLPHGCGVRRRRCFTPVNRIIMLRFLTVCPRLDD